MDKKDRLWSLDALRGFDMFFITGGAGLVMGLCAVLGQSDCWLVHQMQHVKWAGIAHHDTIFPLFLFLAGVSWPFSYAAQVAKGRTVWQIHGKVVRRALTLFAFGLALGGILKFNPSFRVPSVLGQIGLSWGCAAILFIHLKKPLARGLVIAAILIGYWALLTFTGAPGAPAGADLFSRDYNIISWLDRTLMPNHVYVRGVYDPESLFSIPPGIALAMLGMSAGAILRSSRWEAARKAAILAGAAAVMLALGLLFIYVLRMPIVKALWTSSFVLVAAAYSFAMLALFYWIVDVKGWKRWTFYFRVIGMNSITIYLLSAIGVIRVLQTFLFGGLVKQVGSPWGGFVQGLTYQLVCWLVLLFFYRKNIFLRV